jgi:hypothetical protein
MIKAAVAVAGLFLVAGGAPQPRVIVRRAAAVVRPVAGGGFVAWTEAVNARAVRTAVYARGRDGRVWKVDGPSPPARTGGIDGTTLVYSRGGEIRHYDLARRRGLRRLAVTTNIREPSPTLSRGRLLYTRVDTHNRTRVALHDLRSGRERTLFAIRAHATTARSGEVSDNYAVWSLCVEVACTVFRYDIAHRHSEQLAPQSLARPSYAPSVTADGTAYFARSGPGCGESVEIFRARVGRGPEKIYSLPAGHDVFSTYAVSGGGTHVYFDSVACKGGRSSALELSLP